MPDRLSYDESMLYSQRCLKIQDSDLKQGSVETYSIKTSVGEIKKPWGIEGGFAVVYKFRTHSGRMKAMRCFRVAMNPDTQSRYEKMSVYFRQHIPDITIDFQYYEDGILVRETAQGQFKETIQAQQKKVCPVIVMEWVDGVTLLDKVDELCQRRDTQAMEMLADEWLSVIHKLRQAHVAHGDLAGVNAMVRKDGKVALVDYDGVYIPEFAGLPPIVQGQQGYQHPDMGSRPFNEQMDAFSALVIYVSLLALKTQPELWDKYVQRNTRGQLDGNMLFTRDDFIAPDNSAIFADMLRSANAQVRDLARCLKDACLKPNGLMTLPSHLLDPDYLNKQALKELVRAIDREDDDQVIKLWDTSLAAYTPAQSYQSQVDEARRRASALAAFNNALSSCDVFEIADAATPEVFKKVDAAARRIAELALAFAQAFQDGDEDRMVERWQEIQQTPYSSRLTLDAQKHSLLDNAKRRKEALSTYRLKALYNAKYPKPKASIIVGEHKQYSALLGNNTGLNEYERRLTADAYRYTTMFEAVRDALQKYETTRDITPFLNVYDEELDTIFYDDFLDNERRLIKNLINRGKLERALKADAPRLAVATARNIEDSSRTIFSDDRLKKEHEKFIKAFEAKNVQVQFEYGKAYISWEWPDDELVQLAAVVWRYDRWPEHPQTLDPGREMQWVLRRVYASYKRAEFRVGMAQQLYAQVYLAIEGAAGQPKEIYFSRGNEPTSRVWRQIPP